MELTKQIIREAMAQATRPVLSFSGGGDSMVVLDILSHMGYRLPLVYADSQMEYPETLPFVTWVAAHYGQPLHVAKGIRTPAEQWKAQGWPMLGKLPARIWMQNNPNAGFKIDCTGCCRNMKIAPARKITRALGATMQFTGLRGAQDDQLRGLREFKDGAIKYVKADKLLVCSPLLGWTDTMVRRYTEQNSLPVHPAKARGAQTIGCMFCGGGAQFLESSFRICRTANPAAWHWFMVEQGAGEIVLAIKYKKALAQIQQAIQELGGLEKLAQDRPWIFDFLRENPLLGYDRGTKGAANGNTQSGDLTDSCGGVQPPQGFETR